MSMVVMWFKKILITAAITAAGLGALPPVNVYAQSTNPPATPVPSQASNGKLQKAWAREQTIYARIGKILDGANNLISRIQARLDEATAKNKDVSSVQSALDAFSAAVKNVQPIYADMQAIVQSHSGFDNSGNVTDQTQALQTVQDFRSKVEAIRQAGVGEAGKALREAIRSFRQTNQSATPTPSPSSSNG
jgi:cytochrome c556